MHRILTWLLFKLSEDRAHALTLGFLKRWPLWFCKKLYRHRPHAPLTLWGLHFENPVGLAAGFDKNAEAIDAMLALGFGFVEVGAVTPKAQPGNPKPHVRRLIDSNNIVNACGFNNKGVDYVVERLKQRKLAGIVGVNIGKNKHTPNDKALDDYSYCIKKVYAYADFITVNISSPNTAGLRDLHQHKALRALLGPLVKLRDSLAMQHSKKVPLLLKLSPDLGDESIAEVVNACVEHGVDGITATNTSLQHNLVAGLSDKKWPGGLSGPAIAPLARHVLCETKRIAENMPVISVGGIAGKDEAQWRFAHGAQLLQVYTGMVYHGRDLIFDLIHGYKEVHDARKANANALQK